MRAVEIASLLLIIGLLAGFVPVRASADEGEVDEAALAEAKTLFSEGVALYKEGKHAEALEKFKSSYELRPHWRLHLNMGLCYKELNMFAEARAEFDAFLDEGKDELKPKELKQVEAEIADLGSITATLLFEINPPGVTVEVDGEDVTEEAAGFGVEVDPGKHVVQATAEGYEPFKDKVLVSKGASTKVVIDLTPLPDAPGPPPGLPASPEPVKKKSPAAFWAMAGLTLAIGAGAAVTGGLALSKKGQVLDLDRKTEDAFDTSGYTDEAYDDYRDERDGLVSDGQTLGTVTTVLMAGASAALVATVIVGVVTKPFAKKEKPASDVSLNVAPVVLDSGGLLLLGGSF